MRALVVLGARLVRAGGALRSTSLVLGSAVAVSLLAVAWGLPDALYPIVPGFEPDPRRGVLTPLLGLVVAPVVALLLAVGRLSSSVRDRRLAALHLLGVSRARLAVVAATENVLPALLGALLGVGGFLALRTVVERALEQVLREPIEGGVRLACVGLAVVATSVLLALVSLRRLDRPRAAVVESAKTRLSAWRLAPFAVALAAFGVAFATPVDRVGDWTSAVLVVGLVASGAAVVLVTPLVSSWLSASLARRASVAALLAGRAIQTQPAAAGRRVTALGLAVFVGFAAAGYLGVYQSIDHLRYAIRSIEDGPQVVRVGAFDEVADLGAAVPEIAALPGVLDVSPGYLLAVASCQEESCPEVFVGTCEELGAEVAPFEAVTVVGGCRDDQAAWIEPDHEAGTAVVDAARGDPIEVIEPETGVVHAVDVAGGTGAASPAAWPTIAFVPAAFVEQWGARVSSLDVTAEAGAEVRAAVEDVADRHGAWADVGELSDYRAVVTTRATVWSLVGVAVAVSLLTFALTTIDRARETRRPRARLVAVGVPARVLRGAQALSSAIPLLVAIAVGAVLGAVATAAFSHLADSGFAIEPRTLVRMVAAVSLGALVVSLATLPFTRGAVSAADLRQE